MGVGYNPRCVQDGLMLYLDAANRRCYSRTGTSIIDTIRNVNGTLANGAQFSSENNGIFLFDATDDAITFPSNTFVNIAAQSGTFVFVLKIPPTEANSKILFYDGGTTNNFVYFYRNAHWPANQYGWIMYYDNTSAGIGYVLPLHTYTPNTWIMSTFTYESNGVVKLYLNDTLLSTTTPTDFISWKRSGLNQPFLTSSSSVQSSSIALFMHYNRAITLNEVKQNFNATRSRFGI